MIASNVASLTSSVNSTVPEQDRISAAVAPEPNVTVTDELLQLCKDSRNSRPTKFAASGWFVHDRACPLSSIRVAGIDRDIPIPISKTDMTLLKEQAERAPFGFGPQTLMDQTVRDAWQVDGRNVWSETQSSFFQRTVQTMILTSLKEQLGLDTYSMDVHATLYKMLLYEEGGHFLPHRDTEKEPGMFGTYLLQIPVEDGHEGGQLCVRHVGQEVVVDTATPSTSTAFQEIMFYADCAHELKEVTRGRRCVLAFNLCWRAMATDQCKIPMSLVTGLSSSQAAVLPQLVERATALVDRWTGDTASPLWVSVPLDHKYTADNLSFDHLKGKDALMARPFMAVPSSKLALYLVLEEITFLKAFDSDDRDPLFGEESDSKEIIKEMDRVSLRLVSLEGERFRGGTYRHTFFRDRRNGVYTLHTKLHRLSPELVLDATRLDMFQQDIELTGNASQPAERTYFRCLLLLCLKGGEFDMLSALECKEFNTGCSVDVDKVWGDADDALRHDAVEDVAESAKERFRDRWEWWNGKQQFR